jgi:hypothetical protein
MQFFRVFGTGSFFAFWVAGIVRLSKLTKVLAEGKGVFVRKGLKGCERDVVEIARF